MTESSWPFDGFDTTEAQYSYLMRRLQQNGVWGSAETSDLKVFADSTGMQVKVSPGYANIRGFQYNSDSTKVLPITAASSSLARVDSVMLELDLIANTMTTKVVTGSGSTAPTPFQPDVGNFQIELAQITVGVNATTISSANVLDTRRFMGNVPGLWTSATRPAARTGLLGYNLTTKQWEYWDGSAWTPFGQSSDASKLTAGTVPSARLDTDVMRARGDIASTQDWNLLADDGVYRSALGAFTAGTNAPGIGASGPLSTTPAAAGVLIVGRSGDAVNHTYTASTGKVYTRSRTGGVWSVWNELAVYSGASGAADVVVTTGVTPTTGWSLVRFRAIKRNGIASLDVAFKRTGGNITATASGLLTASITVGTFSDSRFTPSNSFAGGDASSAGDIKNLTMNQARQFILTAALQNSVTATGEELSATFSYITAT